MVECEVNKIIIDEQSHEQMVVLKEKSGERFLPIVIGISEAAAIRAKFGGAKPPRPISYDLLVSCVERLGAKVEYIVVDDYKSNVFYAKVCVLDKDGEKHLIDARPSDSIALAVRTKCLIYIEDHLLEISSQAHQN